MAVSRSSSDRSHGPAELARKETKAEGNELELRSFGSCSGAPRTGSPAVARGVSAGDAYVSGGRGGIFIPAGCRGLRLEIGRGPGGVAFFIRDVRECDQRDNDA